MENIVFIKWWLTGVRQNKGGGLKLKIKIHKMGNVWSQTSWIDRSKTSCPHPLPFYLDVWTFWPLVDTSITYLFILNYHVDTVWQTLPEGVSKQEEAQLPATWYLIMANNRKKAAAFSLICLWCPISEPSSVSLSLSPIKPLAIPCWDAGAHFQIKLELLNAHFL